MGGKVVRGIGEVKMERLERNMEEAGERKRV